MKLIMSYAATAQLSAPASILSTVVLLLSLSTPVHAKRVAAKQLPPLTKNGITYSYAVEGLTIDCPPSTEECGARVFILAHRKPQLEPLWKTEVYENMYNMTLETDVQSILPNDMKLRSVLKKKGLSPTASTLKLELVDERGQKYVLDATSGQREEPKDIVKYFAGAKK